MSFGINKQDSDFIKPQYHLFYDMGAGSTVASLVKFNNSGFPNNVTIPARIDTFFNINLFKAFLKKLGEPVKLYGNDNQVVSVDDIGGLNLDKEQQKNAGCHA